MLKTYRDMPIPPNPAEAEARPPQETGEGIVDLTDIHPKVRFWASYRARGITASPARLWVRRRVAEKLCAAADALPEDMGLAVFDALRPAAVQLALFEEYQARLAAEHPDWGEDVLVAATRRFVALPKIDPTRPSNHMTGGAVDLTLYRGDALLDMGTGFDDFCAAAGTRWYEGRTLSPEDALRRDNRRLLYHLMAAQGFTNYEEEWWHYDFGNPAWGRLTGNTACYGYCPVPEAFMRR